MKHIFIVFSLLLSAGVVKSQQCVFECSELEMDLSLDDLCRIEIPDFSQSVLDTTDCNDYIFKEQSPPSGLVASSHEQEHVVMITLEHPTLDDVTCSFILTAIDDIQPNAVCNADPDFNVSLNDVGNGILLASDMGIGSTDNCGVLMFSFGNEQSLDFDCDDLGTNNVMLTVSDGVTDAVEIQCAIDVVDDIPATIVCTSGIEVVLDQNGMGTLTADEVGNGSTDNCDLDFLIDGASSLSFTCNDTDITEVMLTVIDASNESTTANCAISIVDTIPPSLSCASNVVVELGNNLPVVLNASQVNGASSDNCAITEVLINGQEFLNFDCSNLNTTSVTLTVSDASENAASNNCAITVTDIAAPDVSCNPDLTFELPLTGDLTLTAAEIGSGTDNCSIISSETINGMSSLDFTCSNLGINDIVYQAVDGSGNPRSLTCIVNITAPDIGLSDQVSATATIISCDIPDITLSVESMVDVVWTNSVGTTLPSNNGVLMIDERNIPDNNGVGSETFTATSCAGSTGLCCQSVSISISQNTVAPDISISGLPTNNEICQNQSLTLTACCNVSSTSFTWSGAVSSNNPSISFPTNDPGNSLITLTGKNITNGCESMATATITVNELPPITWNGLNNICSSRPAFSLNGMASPRGGFFTGQGIVNNMFNPSVAGVGNISIVYRFTDPSTGCEDSVTSIINVTSPPNSSAMTSTPEVCAGGTILLSSSIASSGLTYSWTGPGGFEEETDIQTFPRQNATTSMSGNYTLTITDNLGCVYTSSTISIDVDNPIQARIQEVDIECNGDTALLTAVASQGSGSFNYSWNNGEMSSSVNVPASTIPYSVTVSDDGPCDNVIDSLLVDEPDQVITTLTILDESCSGAGDGSIEFSNRGGTGGFNTELSNGMMCTSVSSTFRDLIDGNYTVTVTDGNGCSEVQQTTVAPGTSVEVSINGIPTNPNICQDGIDLNLIASGNATEYSWTVNSNIVNANRIIIGDDEVPDSYTIILTGTSQSSSQNDKFCTSNTLAITIDLKDNPKPILTIPEEICQNTSGTASVSQIIDTDSQDNHTFLWSSGETNQSIGLSTIIGSQSRDYVVTVTDSFGCTGETSGNVYVNAQPAVEFEFISPFTNDNPVVNTTFDLDGTAIVQENGASIENTGWCFSPSINESGNPPRINITELTGSDFSNLFSDKRDSHVFTFKATDSNNCSNQVKETLDFRLQDDCRISLVSPSDISQPLCINDVVDFIFNYTPSDSTITPRPDLGRITYTVTTQNGVVAGEISTDSNIDLTPQITFTTIAEDIIVEAFLEETNGGCSERFSFEFDVFERASVTEFPDIDSSLILGVCDTLNPQIQLFGIQPADEELELFYSLDSLPETSVSVSGGSVSIFLNDVLGESNDQLEHEIIFTQVRYANIDNCGSRLDKSYSFRIIECGCFTIGLENPGSIGNEEEVFFCDNGLDNNFYLVDSFIPIDSLGIIDNSFYLASLDGDLTSIFDSMPDQTMEIENIDGDTIELSRDLAKTLLGPQEHGSFFLYRAVESQSGCIRLGDRLPVNIMQAPNFVLESDKGEYCLNEPAARVFPVISNLNALGTNDNFVFDSLTFFDSSIDSLIVLESIREFKNDTLLVGLYEDDRLEINSRLEFNGTLFFNYGEDITCAESEQIFLNIGNGKAVDGEDEFIQWWPGNILASSLQLDSTQQYRYLWGRDSGVPIANNTEWYVVIEEDDFDSNGIPLDGDQQVNYWVDIWTEDSAAECPLRLYYTGDGFAPREDITLGDEEFVIYPNPSQGLFNILLPENYNFIETLAIHSVLGDSIKTMTLNGNTQQLSVELTDNSPGLYICSLSYKNGRTISQKFIIE